MLLNLTMPDWFKSLGMIGYPIAICSVLALALIMERLTQLLSVDWQRIPERLRAMSAEQRIRLGVGNRLPRGLPAAGIGLTLSLHQHSRTQREEELELWLAEQRAVLHARLRWLMLLAVLCPLLGLFGTVLGMIDALQSLAQHQGPMRPDVVAGGLHVAMGTTAAGLMVAIPALVAAHSFRIWADARLEQTQRLVNRVHLALVRGEQVPETQASVMHIRPLHKQEVTP